MLFNPNLYQKISLLGWNQLVKSAHKTDIHTFLMWFKGIVHFEINFCYVLAYLKGIQDAGVFVSAVVSIFIFLSSLCLSVI